MIWTRPARARVLLVDDSEASRDALARILGEGGAEVVGSVEDGQQALEAALGLNPDVVFLDLQMPRMDGFTFLRLLMARRPTPVVVVSSQSRRSDVFRALELGAFDFVPKPEDGKPLESIAAALLEKLEFLRVLRIDNLPSRRGEGAATRRAGPSLTEPPCVVALGASTGGPQALQRLLSLLPGDLPAAILIAQHMPERFTAAFADRLGRTTPFSAQEAAEGDVVAMGRVLVAPGGRILEARRDAGGTLQAAVLGAGPADRHRPSVDRLFTSVAAAVGRRACGVVLTGMGSDGRAGVLAIRRAGGLALAESEESAVIYGMPHAAAESGAVEALLTLDGLAGRITAFARGPGR